MGSAGWFGKLPSSSGNRISTSNGSPSKTLGTTSPPMPLAVSATTFSGRRTADVDERADVVGVGVEHRTVLERRQTVRVELGRAAGAHSSEQGLGGGLDLGQPGVLADGPGAGQAELQPVVPGRVVGGGEHGAGRVEAAGGEVEQVGGGQPEIDDRPPLRPGAIGEGRGQLDPRFAHVPGHQQRRGPGEAGHGHADGTELLGIAAHRGRRPGCRRP